MPVYQSTAIFLCDNKCGYFELVAVIPHATIPGRNSPYFLSANPEDKLTQWHCSSLDGTWFCPTCAVERRAAEEAMKALQKERQTASQSRMSGQGFVPLSQATQASAPAYVAPAPPQSYQPVPVTYQPVVTPQPPRVEVPYQPPPVPQNIPAAGNQHLPPVVIPAAPGSGQQTVNAPQLARAPQAAPVFRPQAQQPPPQPAPLYPGDGSLMPQNLEIPAGAPTQQAPTGEAVPVPLHQMPVRFDVPPFPGR